MFKRKILLTLQQVATNPWVNLIAGLILFVSGTLESIFILFEETENPQIGSHHGVAIFGLLQVFKSLPDAFEGIKFIEEGEERLGDSGPLLESPSQ